MAKSIGRLLLKIFSIVLFVVITITTLFFAYGYRFDFEDRIVQKTSIIDVVPKYNQVKVFVDGLLHANRLPYQVKNVLPGRHNVLVKKDGFINWSRKVDVKEDFVTIIRDVLLVPNSLEEYKEDLVKFDETDTLFFGDSYVLKLEEGSKLLKIVSEFDDGTIKEEEMRLYREGIEYVEGFSEEKFLLRFKETLLEKSLYAYVNFASRQFKVFWLPEDVERIRIGGADNIVFFMKGDTLYRIPFNQLAEEEFELTEDLIVHENVTNYDLDYRGNIFYISVGMLYLVDESGENERLLEKCPGYYKNIALHVNNGSVIMVLRSNEDVRSLFVVESDGDLVLLTESLRDQPFIGVNNQVLYMDTANHLFAYDIYGEDKIYIMQFDQEISLVGWYGEFGHFLYKENGDLLLEDVYSANRYLLMHEEDKEYEYYVNGRSIFYYDKHNLQLSRLYFDEIE